MKVYHIHKSTLGIVIERIALGNCQGYGSLGWGEGLSRVYGPTWSSSEAYQDSTGAPGKLMGSDLESREAEECGHLVHQSASGTWGGV